MVSTHRGRYRSKSYQLLLILLVALYPQTVHALSRVRLMTLNGAAGNDGYGRSVASAGDVNGDGFADIIVGADHNDFGGSDAGRAYVYFGGPGPDLTADLVLTGQAGGNLFGHSVAGAGDVNGDGYADVIVGAPQNSAAGANAGRAYVFYGGPGADAVPDLIFTGAAAGDFLGDAVAGAGDVNGDGYADLIVGARLNDASGSNSGRAYVYFGGPSADNVADLTLTGAAAGDQFGFSVSSAGDVNRDGYSDVIVGAPLNDAGGTDAGRAYVFFGAASPDNGVDLMLQGSAAFDEFGHSVAGAGDVNGDSYGDLIVGAYAHDAGISQNVGQALVYYGGSSPDNVADRILTGNLAFDNFGICVSSAGDVNGDGYADVLVGSNVSAVPGPRIGKASVYFGGPGSDELADLSSHGEVKGDTFGTSVACAGDVNGDGLSDLIVGAADFDPNVDKAGRAYVFVYERGSLGTRIFNSAIGAAATDHYGLSVANAGDVNRDGYADVIVGAPDNDQAFPNAGRAYVYFGGAAADTVPDLVLTGEAANDEFGSSVASAGDVNGDGFGDVIVGAPGNSSNAGRAYVFFGGPFPDAIADLVLTGEASNDNFGFAVSAAGDVNRDGFSDFIVGATGVGSFAGRAYVYFGGSIPDNVADLKKTGAASSDQFGHSVGAGDVNGDGYSDWIVGAPFNSSGASFTGSVSVFYGGASPDTTADLQIPGTAGQNLGWSVGGAGDVDGDGFGDVIAGAPAVSTSAVGHAYLYRGGLLPDATADLTVTQLGLGETFGYSVGGAGDVNGDGFSDLVVGSGSLSNNAFVYFGGSVLNAGIDLILSPQATNSMFGFSVALGGDTNGDGLDEVLVGAPNNDTSSFHAGQLFVLKLDRAPLVSAPSFEPAEEFGTVTFTVRASDPDGDLMTSLSMDKSALPGGNDASFTAPPPYTSGSFTWHTQSGMAGDFNVIFTATATLSRSDTTRIHVTGQGTSVLGTFTWTPTAADVGAYDVLFTADGAEGSDSVITHVTVTAPSPSAAPVVRPAARMKLAIERGPIISAPTNASVSAGSTLTFSVTATDADTLSSVTTGLPGDNTATFTVDRSPVVTAPSSWSADPSTLVSFTVTAVDSDGDAITGLTADLSYLPQGNNATFTPNGSNTSGLFTWTPSASDSGAFIVVFHAANSLADVATTAIMVKNKLKGYWPLDGSGSDAAAGQSFTTVGGVTFSTGRIGSGAADISGASAGRLTRATTSSSFDITAGGFTFESWVNVRSLAFGIDPRIAFAGSTGTSYWEVHVCDEGCTTGRVRLRLVVPPSTTLQLMSGANINDAAWHHVATTYDGAKVRLYVDGALSDSLAQTGLTVSTGGGNLSLGARPAGENQFDGLIDDVRIWSRARTQAEIQATMNQPLFFPTGIDGEAPVYRSALRQNRPNPFNPATQIEFTIERAGRVRLQVFDVSGRAVATLLDRELAAGPHGYSWSGRDDQGRFAGSGIYFYRVEAPGFTQTRKMTLLK